MIVVKLSQRGSLWIVLQPEFILLKETNSKYSKKKIGEYSQLENEDKNTFSLHNFYSLRAGNVQNDTAYLVN